MNNDPQIWSQIMTNHGLAVTIALFLMVVVFPLVFWSGVRIARWVAHESDWFLNELTDTQKKMVASQVQTHEAVRAIIDNEAGHQAIKVNKLDEIHGDVRHVRGRVDAIHERLGQHGTRPATE
jgi:hypothetical protein